MENPRESKTRHPLHIFGFLMGFLGIFGGFKFSYGCMWVLAFWIKDSSMPTRKRKGVAGKCTLPAGLVHNPNPNGNLLCLSSNCRKELLLLAGCFHHFFFGGFLKGSCEVVRVCSGWLRFYYWDIVVFFSGFCGDVGFGEAGKCWHDRFGY